MWPRGTKPSDLSDFETQARILRYRSLGAACRDFGIRHLLLGHHADDQAETVLMRVASGHKGRGLRGMQECSTIPECWGMHGVYESGQYEYAKRKLERLPRSQQDSSMEHARHIKSLAISDPTVEKGGVVILRPLLDFSKQQLIETCRAHDVTWEDDKTNYDVWRTPRNTIRELLSGFALPIALRKRSMLEIVRKTLEHSLRIVAISGKLFVHCKILLFDARSGGLVVRFPENLVSFRDQDDRDKAKYLANARSTCATMLRRFVQMVTPRQTVPLLDLQFAVLSMFPELSEGYSDVNSRLQPNGFTACGVQFQRLRSPLFEESSGVKEAGVQDGKAGWNTLNPDFVWKLTREPFSAALPSLKVLPPVSFASPIPMSGVSAPDTHITLVKPAWSSWEFWDGRYWIRVLNHMSRTLVVRPFQPADLQALKSTLSLGQWRMFYRVLGQAAPGQLRWTLLTIAEVGSNEREAGKVLVLPTLGQAGEVNIEDEHGLKRLDWKIRYKKVRLGYKDDPSVSRNRDIITTWND